MTDIELEGMDDLLGKFEDYIPELEKKLTDEIAPQVVQVMRSLAVKDVRVDTGHLRQSLQDGKALIGKEGEHQVFMGISTSVEYARYVEYGTGNKGDPAVPHVPKDFWWAFNPEWTEGMPESKRFIRWYAQPPRPYLRPALKGTEKIAVKLMKEGAKAVFK